jgi:hypothetical protein
MIKKGKNPEYIIKKYRKGLKKFEKFINSEKIKLYR